MDKLKFTKLEIIRAIVEAVPPEKTVAKHLFIYGITEQEFSDMRSFLDISHPTHLKIMNYLRDEWRKRRSGLSDCQKN